MSKNTVSPVTPTRKGDGQPTKHILLQQERLVTHDRTWLPARLQPPSLPPGTPYASYLLEYEQYLDALQYMKKRFLETRRFDPKAVRKVDPKVAPIVSLRVATQTNNVVRTSQPGLVFGDVHTYHEKFPPTLRSAPSEGDWLSVVPVHQRKKVQEALTAKGISTATGLAHEPVELPLMEPLVKNVPTSRQKSSRKAAKKARRKARVAAKKEEQRLVSLKLSTEEVEAKRALASAKLGLAVVNDKTAKRRARSAGDLRRRAARSARRRARAAAPAPEPSTSSG